MLQVRRHIRDTQKLGPDLPRNGRESMRRMLLEMQASHSMVRNMEVRIPVSRRPYERRQKKSTGQIQCRERKGICSIPHKEKRGGTASGDKTRPGQGRKKIILIRLRAGFSLDKHTNRSIKMPFITQDLPRSHLIYIRRLV